MTGFVSLGGTMDCVLALHPVALGLILSVPKNFFFDVAEMLFRTVDRGLKMSI